MTSSTGSSSARARDLTDALASSLHRLTRGPADKETEMPRSGRVAAYPTVMEAEKVQPLTAFAQLHDPCLGVLEREPQLEEDGS